MSSGYLWLHPWRPPTCSHRHHRPGKPTTMGHHSAPSSANVLCFVLAVHNRADMTADGATLARLISKSLMEVGLDMTPVATIGVDSASTNLGEEKGLVSQLGKLPIEHGTQQPPVVAARCSHHIAHNPTKKGDEAMSGMCTMVRVQILAVRDPGPFAPGTWRPALTVSTATRWWRGV
jgi:hypothetical protein